MRTSTHAKARSQQRGIPRFIDELLDRYGLDEHVGDGRTVRFFNKVALRRMEREMGRPIVAQFARWFDCYKVVGADGGAITIGHRYRHIRRK